MNEAMLTPGHVSVIVLKLQEFTRRPVADQTRLKAQIEALVALAIQLLPAADRIVLTALCSMRLTVSRSWCSVLPRMRLISRSALRPQPRIFQFASGSTTAPLSPRPTRFADSGSSATGLRQA